MESLDSSMRPSTALKMFGGNIGKRKRRKVSKNIRNSGKDVPKNHVSTCHISVVNMTAEQRVLLYMERAAQADENKVALLNPINIFTGVMYTDEELKIEEGINED